MGYVKSFDREKEIEILTRIAKNAAAIAGKRSVLARARNQLKQCQDVHEDLKRELFVCRFGQAALDSRIANAGKARVKLAEKRVKQLAEKRAANAVFTTTIDTGEEAVVTALKSTPPQKQQQLLTPLLPTLPTVVPKVAERSADNQHECTRCGAAITPRGLCACPGVRHRAVRKVFKGPNITIKHPPVPAFQMGAEKVELS